MYLILLASTDNGKFFCQRGGLWLGVLNNDELQYIIDKVQDIITKIKYYNEQYEKMYTTCYWSEVKMSNRREVFQDTEIEAVNQLGKFLENLMTCSEQIIKMAEAVRVDLYKVQNIDDPEICNAYSDIIIEKLHIMAIGNKYLSEMQEEYVRCSMLVEKIIDKPSKTSMWDKIKMHLWKNRMHFICKK